MVKESNRYAAVTNWRISLGSPTNKNSNISSYIIQIHFPRFFSDFQTASNFASNLIKTLHYYKHQQSLDGVMSVIDIDEKEFYANVPHFSMGVVRKSRDTLDEATVGSKYASIYCLKGSHPTESDLSLLEYAQLLGDECSFEKLWSDAECIQLV